MVLFVIDVVVARCLKRHHTLSVPPFETLAASVLWRLLELRAWLHQLFEIIIYVLVCALSSVYFIHENLELAGFDCDASLCWVILASRILRGLCLELAEPLRQALDRPLVIFERVLVYALRRLPCWLVIIEWIVGQTDVECSFYLLDSLLVLCHLLGVNVV